MITDIKTYGENALQHGWNKTFLGNSSHNKLNAEEALNQMFGTAINDAGSKEKAEMIGSGAAWVGEALGAGAVGTAAGLSFAGLGKIFTPKSWAKTLEFKFGRWGKIGALAAAAGDVIWQMSR